MQRSNRHRQALLEQAGDALLAHALAPTGHRGTVERQLVAEELFATEVLEVWAFNPPRHPTD
jgi:hypothetical protein